MLAHSCYLLGTQLLDILCCCGYCNFHVGKIVQYTTHKISSNMAIYFFENANWMKEASSNDAKMRVRAFARTLVSLNLCVSACNCMYVLLCLYMCMRVCLWKLQYVCLCGYTYVGKSKIKKRHERALEQITICSDSREK